MFTSEFALALFERALRTFAQAFGAFLAAGATGVLDADWQTAASVSGMAALLSVLTSIAAGAVAPDSGASFGTETPNHVGADRAADPDMEV